MENREVARSRVGSSRDCGTGQCVGMAEVDVVFWRRPALWGGDKSYATLFNCGCCCCGCSSTGPRTRPFPHRRAGKRVLDFLQVELRTPTVRAVLPTSLVPCHSVQSCQGAGNLGKPGCPVGLTLNLGRHVKCCYLGSGPSTLL